MRERFVQSAFRIALIIKGVYASVEFLSGSFILFASQNLIVRIVFRLTRHEISEDPDDFIANLLRTTAQNLSINAQHFAALYLVFNGMLKLILIFFMFKKDLRAYRVGFVVFSVFILYEFYRFAIHGSPFILGLALFDCFVLVLTWHEYRYLSRSR